MKKFLRLLPYLIVVVLFAGVLVNCRLIVTSGPSMEPSYHTGDKLFCVRALSPPSKGDIILFEKDGKLLVKRVIAGPGDVADLPEDKLPAYDYWGSTTVPDDCIFVAGDNLEHSYDSRDPKFGLVPYEAIWGYIVFKF